MLGALLASSAGMTACTNNAAPSSPPPASSAAPPPGRDNMVSSNKQLEPPKDVNPADYDNLQAVIETERGNIIIKFYPHEAPITVANFVQLSRAHFYDGLTWHRVEKNPKPFVIQGGDPNGNGTGGPGYNIPAEFNDHKHVPGAVAMARGQDPNSAGSQFYICLGDAPFLDHQYTVFGQVVAGMDAVNKIQKGDHMLKITVEQKPAEGAAGSSGTTGASGTKAATGMSGTTSASGAAGSSGPAAGTGASGATGSSAATGASGSSGASKK
jgi:cyclophilin family peptidyl-prolyl cis-trans isomerase